MSTASKENLGDSRQHQSTDSHAANKYILESLIALWIIYFGFLIALKPYRKILRKEQRFSMITVLFSIIIVVKFVVFTIQIIIMLIYGSNGRFDYIGFMVFEIFNELDVLIFMEILILLGLGLTIVFGKLSVSVVTMIVISIIAYFVLIVVIISVDIANFSSALIGSMYNQLTGYTLVAIEFLMALTFASGCLVIIYRYRSHRTFYLIFGAICFLWFISVPILIIVAINAMKAYLRFSVVVIARNFLDFFAHLFYFLITYPKLFPNLVIYTTPANVIANVTFENSLTFKDEEPPVDIQVNNRQFFNLAEFQATDP